MASAAAALAASVGGAVVSNSLCCSQSRVCRDPYLVQSPRPQNRVYHNRYLVQFPYRVSRYALGIVRQQPSARIFCATQSAPPTEIEQQEDKASNNGSVESSLKETPLKLAEAILQIYEEALGNGDVESLTRVKAQLQEVVDERDSLNQQVASLKADIESAKDRFLRLNADFENFRRRSLQEKSALSDSAKGEIIESLLPMIDSFERAKGAIKAETAGEEKIDSSYQGIYKQFVEIMRGLGVSVVETVGKPFDPEIHEAIMREESEQYEEGVVTLEFRRGFKLGDKLLRPAMVKVSSGPGKSTPSPSTESSSTPEPETDSV